MYTTTTPIEKIGNIDIVKRQNLGNATHEFILEKEGEMLYEESKYGKSPHLYFSLSVARINASYLAGDN